MKQFLVFLSFLLFTSTSLANDVKIYTSSDSKGLSAIITDEPCAEVVLKLFDSTAPKPMLDSLKRVKADFYGQQLEACVLPADDDGDYAIIDQEGRTGYLMHYDIKPIL